MSPHSGLLHGHLSQLQGVLPAEPGPSTERCGCMSIIAVCYWAVHTAVATLDHGDLSLVFLSLQTDGLLVLGCEVLSSAHSPI